MSLEITQPTTTATERKTSVTIERPIINLDPPRDSPKRNSAVVEAVRASALAKGGGSRSFEQPAPLNERPKTRRMCASLDVTATARLEGGESLIVEEVDRAEKEEAERKEWKDGAGMCEGLEEGGINAPLLESLKSSDVWFQLVN